MDDTYETEWCPGCARMICVVCPPLFDQNGVEFGSNCVTLATCHRVNLCNGTCKLF